MPTLTSQGSTASWNGNAIGYITGIQVNLGNAIFEDATSVASDVIGSGSDARIVRQWECVAIEPGTAEIRLYGVPNYSLTDIGSKATLAIVLADSSFSAQAYLESFDVSASVGEFLVGTAKFRFA